MALDLKLLVCCTEIGGESPGCDTATWSPSSDTGGCSGGDATDVRPFDPPPPEQGRGLGPNWLGRSGYRKCFETYQSLTKGLQLTHSSAPTGDPFISEGTTRLKTPGIVKSVVVMASTLSQQLSDMVNVLSTTTRPLLALVDKITNGGGSSEDLQALWNIPLGGR